MTRLRKAHTTRSEPLPADLPEARRRFAAWRRSRRPGTRIPESLWRLASQLASRHGVCPVEFPDGGGPKLRRRELEPADYKLLLNIVESYDYVIVVVGNQRITMGRFRKTRTGIEPA